MTIAIIYSSADVYSRKRLRQKDWSSTKRNEERAEISRNANVPDYYVECKPKSMCLYINRDFLRSNASITADEVSQFKLSGMSEDENGVPCRQDFQKFGSVHFLNLLPAKSALVESPTCFYKRLGNAKTNSRSAKVYLPRYSSCIIWPCLKPRVVTSSLFSWLCKVK